MLNIKNYVPTRSTYNDIHPPTHKRLVVLIQEIELKISVIMKI